MEQTKSKPFTRLTIKAKQLELHFLIPGSTVYLEEPLRGDSSLFIGLKTIDPAQNKKERST